EEARTMMATSERVGSGAAVATAASPYARIRGVDLATVRWRPGFWADRFRQCHDVTLPHLWQLMDSPAGGHALTNLRIAAGELEGEFKGTHWQDEWVYKWIEAAAYVFGVTADPDLDAKMDEAIAVVARAQQPDGYIATQTTVRGWPRFRDSRHHEVYVMGHLLTAACAHYRATGKTSLLDVARRTGDFLHRMFVPRNPALAHIVFNPSHVMGLVELYRTTGERRYLDAANAFIDLLGSEPGGSDQRQDRVPLRRETQVVGHMVLATYLYAGATDAYLETGNETLLEAVDRLWHDLTEKRMYVHGGVAPIHRGFSIRNGRGTDDVHEAAGDDYELPNSTAYNETCAQIGNVLWNWRLLAANARARHADIMELSLYNSILSGIGLDGKSWFYTNPLRWYGKDQPLHSNDAYERFQPGLRHICCPSNLVRTIAGLHGYLYGLSEEGLWLHLYGASTFDGRLLNGQRLRLAQETDYPWNGEVKLTIEVAPAEPFAIMLRIPGWAERAAVTVNEEAVNAPVQPGAYAAVRRSWRAGDVLALTLPMEVRLLEGNPRIEAVRNQVAVARGPLVYCLESPDLPGGTGVSEVFLPPDAHLTPRHDPSLLGGVTVLEGEAQVFPDEFWSGQLYRPLARTTPRRQSIRLIPYYAWANRGISELTVWLPLQVALG
ncbi:MAG: glycoside hydrolase family 127 protein, partial [Chloroflexota bacterium]